jgi:cytoskeleton protein RodZ
MTEPAAEFDAPDPAANSGSFGGEAQSAGAQLKRAREAAGLTGADVAGKLKFSVKQIDLLEADSYAALGGPTFVRGLARTYAKLLNLEPTLVLEALGRSELPPETGQVAADRKGIPFPAKAKTVSPILRYVSLSIALIAGGILVLYLWHGEELFYGPATVLPAARRATPAPSSSPVAVNVNPTLVDNPPPGAQPKPTPVSVAPPAASVEANPAPTQAAPALDKSNYKAADNPAAKPAPAANPGSALGAKRIQLSFARDSWVEIRDGGGHIVFSQLNPRGSEQSVEGRAPFELVIGNAPAVTLRYRDAVVDLKPYTRADVARLTLN